MSTASWISFCSLVELRKKPTLFECLSEKGKREVQDLSVAQGDPFTRPYTIRERLDRVHYSWLITFLEPFAENDKEIIFSSLAPHQSEKLRAHFSEERPSASLCLKEKALDYLNQAMYEWLTSDQTGVLPIEFLPAHPLNPLIDLDKKSLQTLTNYLGLHDLAIELKHVIKSDQVKKIQAILTPKESDYLRGQLKGKAGVTFARLNLSKWSGSGGELKAILHQRGFNRLAKGLFGCHPSLIWHISHRFDTGRAKILRKFCTDIKSDAARSVLIQQILGIIPLLKEGW